MKGIYVLIISVDKDTIVDVGVLGQLNFKKGLYAYVGSAQANLEKRIERHLRKESKRKFWHVDYLLDSSVVDVVTVFYKGAAKSEECEVAKKLNSRGVPVEGFGSSDCNCQGHLFRIRNCDFLREFAHELRMQSGECAL
jgi:Uri superfamily endonuclease